MGIYKTDWLPIISGCPLFPACWALSLCKNHLYEQIETGSAGAMLSLRTRGDRLIAEHQQEQNQLPPWGPHSQGTCCGLVGPKTQSGKLLNCAIQNERYCLKVLSAVHRLRQRKAMITPRLAWRANRTKRRWVYWGWGGWGTLGQPWQRDGEGHRMVVETLGGGEGNLEDPKGDTDRWKEDGLLWLCPEPLPNLGERTLNNLTVHPVPWCT